tara:strand:+ start:432 stop:566 length:135 start_codon:yes stop_codon:yes gene_type:complete
VNEINIKNILGHGGKIAKNYAKLLKNLWITEKDVYIPKRFKRLL